MDNTQTAVFVGQLFTFLAVVMGFLFQGWREGRQRRWDKEDFTAAHAKVLTAVVENTELTKLAVLKAEDAYHEANASNNKIEKLAQAGLVQQGADQHGAR